MAMDRDNPNYPTSPGREGGGDLHFRCADLHPQCNWEARGRNEQELRPKIEQHGREKHGMTNISDDIWNRVRTTFRRSAA